MTEPVVINLPWPISVNKKNTISNRTGQIMNTPRYRNWKFNTGYEIWTLQKPKRFTKNQRMKMILEVYPPDARRRDLDNIVKIIQDVLTDIKIYKDDCLIDDLHILRREVERPNGRVVATLSEIKQEA